MAIAVVLALLTGATSPVAGAFLCVAGGGLVIRAVIDMVGSGAWRERALWPDRLRGELGAGLAVAVAAVTPVGLATLLGSDGGVMNISNSDAWHAMVTGLVVAALLRAPAARIGALLSVAMVAAAYLVPSPVGLNATRLATMFALPVVAGYAQAPRWLIPTRWAPATGILANPRIPLVVALVALALWQPPVLRGDLADGGNPTASRDYFAPLVTELTRRAPLGRVEVPPTRDYWEAAYVARAVPLARGWLRQVDTVRNALFFNGTLDQEAYHAWLVENAVSYVAVPDAELSWIGRGEADVVEAHPWYLSQVWRSAHWSLFEVADAPTVVEGATEVSVTGVAVTFDVTVPGEVLVRVRPSRWLRVLGPATPGAGRPAGDLAGAVRASGRWTVVSVRIPGRYTLTS